MMQVQVGKKKLHITFRHGTYVPEGLSVERRFTKCEIATEGKGGKLVELASATAKTNVLDVFTREGGRKAALKKAMTDLKLSRADRQIVWAAYHNRPRTKSTPPGTQSPPQEKPVRLTAPLQVKGKPIPAPLSTSGHRIVSKVVNMPDRWNHDLERMTAVSGTH